MRGSAAFRAAVAPGGVLAGPWVGNELWRRARAVPSLDLRFAENKSLGDAVTGQSLVTFTRASSGTYVGSDGLIKSAVTDEARFDHDPTTGESLGLLVEESRTNYIPYSETILSNVPGVNDGTIVDNAAVAPDGTTTAASVTATGVDPYVVVNTAAGVSAGTYTFSIYLKGDAGNSSQDCRLRIQDTGTGLQTSNSILITTDWRRYSFTAITTGDLQFVRFDIPQFAVPGDIVYVWGLQLEAGAFPTSYIPTTSSAVTRAADVASIEGTNFNTAQFARASTATFYNSSGIITTANADIPRNNYNPTTLVAEGLLLEPQRQNLLLHSEDVDQHTLANVTTSLDATTAPDNATTADEIAPTATTAEHYVGYSVSVTAGITYTFSAYVKPNGAPAVRMRFALAGFDNEVGAHVFATNTTTPGTANLRVIAIQNGWYRIEGTATASATAAGEMRIYLNNVNSWLGVPAEAMYVWGAQLEEGADATSYIPTTTTEVTRSADVPAVSPWYRQDEGTILYDQTVFSYPPAATASFYAFSDGTTDNRISGFIPSGSNHRLRIDESGSNTYLANAVFAADVLNPARVALAFKTNDVNCAYNGTLRLEDQSVTIPLVDRLNFGEFNAAVDLSTRIKRFIFWPQRLSDSTLANITQ